MEYKWNIEFENAGLIYPNGKEALKNINLKINEGEMVAIIGLSGAGKTTLLKTINKLQDITSGNLFVGDRSEEALASYDKKKNKFKNENKKLKSFSENHKLTKKIVESFVQDLSKGISFKQKNNLKLKENIEKIKKSIKTLEIKYEESIKKLGSKKAAIPYLIQIKDRNNLLKNSEKKLSKQIKELNIFSNHYNYIFSLAKKWEKNKDKINKELIKRLKERVKYFKTEYQKSRLVKPFYKVKKLSGKTARKYKSNIGMVFQRYNLVYKASVLTNALSGRLSKMPWWRAITGIWSKQDKKIAFKALADVNILEATYSRAEDLSGGQMQRVALARTITQGARLFLADEPVGALDPIMAKSVMDSFLEINQKTGKTVIMNLHHVDLALTYADRIIGVKEGQIVYDGKSTKIDLKILKKIYGNQLEGFDAHELKEIMRKRKKVKG